MNHEDYLYWVVGFKKRKGFTVDEIYDYEDNNNICRPLKRDVTAMLRRNQMIEVANTYDCKRDSIDWIYEGISDTHFRVVNFIK